MKPELERQLEKMQRGTCQLAWILLAAIGFVIALSGLLITQGEM